MWRGFAMMRRSAARRPVFCKDAGKMGDERTESRGLAAWEEFARDDGETAELARRIFSKYGIAYLATVRDNGWPRLHPVSPAIVGGKIVLGIIPGTPKLRDLESDGRCVLHGLPGPGDAEICLTGIARRLPEADVDHLIEIAPPNIRLARDTPLFELDLGRVNCTTYRPGPDDRPVPTKTRWTPARRAM
jgi:hypothetical protein